MIKISNNSWRIITHLTNPYNFTIANFIINELFRGVSHNLYSGNLIDVCINGEFRYKYND